MTAGSHSEHANCLTAEDAAAVLEVSVTSIGRRVRLGLLDAHACGDGALWIARSSVYEALRWRRLLRQAALLPDSMGANDELAAEVAQVEGLLAAQHAWLRDIRLDKSEPLERS